MIYQEEPLLKLLHLALLSCSWSIQIWYTFFTSFLMGHVLNRHVHGYVQSRLLPLYYYIGFACAFCSLILFELYRPHNHNCNKETIQVLILITCLIAAALNAHYFGAVTWKIMAEMYHIEQSRGIGRNIWPTAHIEAYVNLSQLNAVYKRLRDRLWVYHWLSSLFNISCIICNTCSLYFLTQNLCLH